MALRLLPQLIILLPLASAFPFESLLIRRDNTTCGGDASLKQCGTGFPTSFCCASDTRCVLVNSTNFVTTICCPTGKDCGIIQPITCNITLQSPKLFPASSVHTLNLTQTLPKCNEQCCPLGYACNGAGNCEALLKRAVTSDNSTTSGASNVTVSSASEPALADESGFSSKSFIAGFVPGIVLGAALFFLIIFLIARRRSRSSATHDPLSSHPPSSSHLPLNASQDMGQVSSTAHHAPAPPPLLPFLSGTRDSSTYSTANAKPNHRASLFRHFSGARTTTSSNSSTSGASRGTIRVMLRGPDPLPWTRKTKMPPSEPAGLARSISGPVPIPSSSTAPIAAPGIVAPVIPPAASEHSRDKAERVLGTGPLQGSSSSQALGSAVMVSAMAGKREEEKKGKGKRKGLGLEGFDHAAAGRI